MALKSIFKKTRQPKKYVYSFNINFRKNPFNFKFLKIRILTTLDINYIMLEHGFVRKAVFINGNEENLST